MSLDFDPLGGELFEYPSNVINLLFQEPGLVRYLGRQRFQPVHAAGHRHSCLLPGFYPGFPLPQSPFERLHLPARRFQTPQKLYLVMEFCAGGDMFHHLRKENKFGEERAKFYAAEIVLALECLHIHGVIYRYPPYLPT